MRATAAACVAIVAIAYLPSALADWVEYIRYLLGLPGVAAGLAVLCYSGLVAYKVLCLWRARKVAGKPPILSWNWRCKTRGAIHICADQDEARAREQAADVPVVAEVVFTDRGNDPDYNLLPAPPPEAAPEDAREQEESDPTVPEGQPTAGPRGFTETERSKESRMLTVSSGINNLPVPHLAGRTVGDIRRACGQAINIEPEAQAYVNGAVVAETTVVTEGNLEFIKKTGEKGVRN